MKRPNINLDNITIDCALEDVEGSGGGAALRAACPE